MSEAGTLFKRYVWLIDTVQTGHWTKEDLMRKWLHSSLNDRQEEMADKTFHNHINAINNIFGLHIKCHKYGDKTYYIENENSRNILYPCLSIQVRQKRKAVRMNAGFFVIV